MNELFVLATDSTFTLYWDKPERAKRDQAYDVLVNGEKAATVCRTHITLEGFAPLTEAEFAVICELDGETLHMQARGKTRAARRRIDVTKAPYLAAGDGETLNTAALHCSEREQRADDAERSLEEIKKFRYLEQVLADGRANRFEAVVAKCTRYGLFVDLPTLAVGGMVHVSTLCDAYVRWNDFNETLEGGGQVWEPGTKLTVRVEKVDFDRRLVDFVPVRPAGRATGSRRRRS